MSTATDGNHAPQQFLNLRPLPQEQAGFRPTAAATGEWHLPLRRARFRGLEDSPVSYFRLVSRLVGRELLSGDVEKEGLERKPDRLYNLRALRTEVFG